jgi:hypothetical protein
MHQRHAATIASSAMMLGVGFILGTEAHSNPEPARGKMVDKRAGTSAVGCVPFEMLPGPTRGVRWEDGAVTKILERDRGFTGAKRVFSRPAAK